MIQTKKKFFDKKKSLTKIFFDQKNGKIDKKKKNAGHFYDFDLKKRFWSVK